MSDEAQAEMEEYRRKERKYSLIVSASVVVLGSLLLWLAKIFIVAPDEPQFIVYTPPDDGPGVTSPTVQDLSGGTPPSLPPISVSVSVDSATVFMPSVDTTALDGLFSGESADGMGLGGNGLGTGYGDGNAAGMGGKKSSSCFCGRFWDLKKTSGGADSPYKEAEMNKEVMKLISRFYNGGWNPSTFASYFESKVKLYTNCFFMPSSLDTEASHAYDPDGKMGLAPCRWVAIYRARVKAPVSGRFRFIGAGDSVMGVRFNGRNVLECGFHSMKTGEWNGNVTDSYISGHEYYQYESCRVWTDHFGGFQAGEVFTVEAGRWYDMDVLVSEIGGGEFGFCLLIDDMDSEKKKDADGQPIFQLFRTSFIAPDADELYAQIKYKDENSLVHPPYDPDSMMWEAKPVESNPSSRR